jgi:hypothetical protein
MALFLAASLTLSLGSGCAYDIYEQPISVCSDNILQGLQNRQKEQNNTWQEWQRESRKTQRENQRILEKWREDQRRTQRENDAITRDWMCDFRSDKHRCKPMPPLNLKPSPKLKLRTPPSYWDLSKKRRSQRCRS